MLDYFFRLSRFLRPFRRVLIILIVVFCLMTVISLFTSASANPTVWLQLGLSGTLWSALLLATTDMFHAVPPRISENASWFRRVKRRLVRFFYGALAVLLLLSSLALLSTTFKLIRV